MRLLSCDANDSIKLKQEAAILLCILLLLRRFIYPSSLHLPLFIFYFNRGIKLNDHFNKLLFMIG